MIELKQSNLTSIERPGLLLNRVSGHLHADTEVAHKVRANHDLHIN